MKIGIMSMQRVENYGSYLQAYGLKRTIENLGHTVQFVDYQVETSLIKSEKEPVLAKFINKIKKIFYMLLPRYREWRRRQICMNETFSLFQEEYRNTFLPSLGVTDERNECAELDILVIGSDEVFNCTQAGNNVGYSKQLFGKDHRAKKLISYAASFGSTTIEKLQYFELEKEIGSLLERFDSISIRDKNSADIINKICNISTCKNIDPVLLYDFSEIDELTIDLDNYIVIYAYADRIGENEAKIIKKFAKEKNKKILTLGFCQPFADEYRLVEPLAVLAYIKNADYVVTDTFHGTVFSIKYQVPFGTIIRESNQEKLDDLLETFELRSREIRNINDLPVILEKQLEKENVQKILKLEQNRAQNYLRSNLILFNN